MNRIRNSIFALTLVMILCIGLASCGSGDQKKSGSSAVAGTWQMTSIEKGGKKTSAENYLKSANASKVPTLTFEDNGSVTLDVDGDTGTGTWENANGQYTLTYKSDGEDVVKEIVLEGDQLSLEQNGFRLTYEKK